LRDDISFFQVMERPDAMPDPAVKQLCKWGVMLSDLDVCRAADAMRREFGEAAELQAAKYADLMQVYNNRAGLLVWARIWRSVAERQSEPTGLPH
jgi:hypothetical protein